MKYYKRLKVWKANNVVFYPESIQAYSYNWWRFVDLIKGHVVFNSFSYSNSTCKHQIKVCSLMRELGINIDYYVESPGGLQNLNSAKVFYLNKIDKLKAEIATPRNHKAKNEQRKQQIKELSIKIFEVECLMLFQQQKGA